MTHRPKQPAADKRANVEFAQRHGLSTYKCRVCGWIEHDDGYVYDELMQVCGYCAARLMNLYHRKHGGEWWSKDRASDDDLAAFGDKRTEPEVAKTITLAKAKVKNRIRLQIYERDGFKCVYCGARKDLTLDHVKAESKGGDSTNGNLVTCCRKCNCKKGTKSLVEFWEGRQ